MTEEPKIKKAKTVPKHIRRPPKRRPKFQKQYVTVAECPLCGDILFSRARHDYRTCSCGNTSVDGGLDLFKLSWAKKKPKSYRLVIIQTKHQLYDDWNTGANLFGLIKLENTEYWKMKGRGYGRKTEGTQARKAGRLK